MTDKPLDCIGIDPAKQNTGKHDFQPWTPIYRRSQAEENDRLRTAIREYIAGVKALLRYPPSGSRDKAAARLLERLEREVATDTGQAYNAIAPKEKQT